MSIKFLHTSDMHLGKKFNIKNFSLKEREKRRQEIWDGVDEIIKVAKNEAISYIFIAGDFADMDYIDYGSLYKASQKFKSIPMTNVLIVCGKNDAYNINNLYEYIEWPQNVRIIKNTDTMSKLKFEEHNLCVHAMSWDNDKYNDKIQAIYDISVDDNNINVLLLYCDINSDSENLPVNMDFIKNKFEYCALGGRHNYERIADNIVYPGTPEPLSFSETGEHGIVTGTLEKKNTAHEFRQLAKRKFITRNIDLDITYSYNKILDLIKFSGNTFSNIKDYVKINLNGIASTDISMEEIENEAKQFFYYIEFADNYLYKNPEDKVCGHNDYNIIESYKLQFDNSGDKLEQQAFKLGLEVLRKEKVVQ